MKMIKSKKKVKDESVTKTKKKFKINFKKIRFGEKLLIVLMLLLIFIFTGAVAFFTYIVLHAPSFDEEDLYPNEASIIYDVHGNEAKRLGTEKRENISYDDLPEVFIDALIATEDARFFQHSGVDMARFVKATAGQILGDSGAGGASTLTMQVIKLRYTDSTSTGIKGIIRKFTDVYMAVFKLEKKYTKEQIIEFYVNIPYLGSGAWGIEQASQIYFDKPAKEMTLTESALIAGLFQAPHAYDPFHQPEKAEARRNQVLYLMERHGYITMEEYEIAKAISVESMLSKSSANTDEFRGVWDTIIQEVIDRTGNNPNVVPMKIYSTFDLEKQLVINAISSDKFKQPDGSTYKWPNDVIQTGIAVIDVQTGGITAVGAGRNKKGELSLNYATFKNQIERHPGSTAKPIFGYGPAIEYLNWSTGQMIVDDVHTFSNGLGIKNWDSGYQGMMTAKVALAASRNIPALQAFQALSQKQINEFVTGLGITPEYDSNGYINESHSIGGFTGTNPVELAAAYATFARGGIYIEPHSFTKVEYIKSGDTYTVTPEKRTVMRDSTAYMINMMLRFAVSGGHISAGSKSGTDIASKTGTSTVDSSLKKKLGITASIIGDSWQVVYSPDYVCATWIGYDEITKEHYLTSSVGSTARKAISKTLTAGIMKANSTFKHPSSVVSATIELETNPLQLASEFTPAKLKSTELFRKGTGPSEVSTRFSKLTSPTNLTVNYAGGVTALSWNPAPLPDAVNPTYLTEYFNNGWGKWANKYYNQRLSYNSANIGNFGYQVYINSGGTVRDLGWTANSNFTYTGYVTENTSFIVKSSYSIFKDNMSDGISAVIDTGSLTTTWKLEPLVNTCLNVGDYNLYETAGTSLVKIVEGSGTELPVSVTDKVCTNTTTNTTIPCANMNNTTNYTLKINVTHNTQTKSLTFDIKNTC